MLKGGGVNSNPSKNYFPEGIFSRVTDRILQDNRKAARNWKLFLLFQNGGQNAKLLPLIFISLKKKTNKQTNKKKTTHTQNVKNHSRRSIQLHCWILYSSTILEADVVFQHTVQGLCQKARKWRDWSQFFVLQKKRYWYLGRKNIG